jgi:single-stranded DNA-binding protein
LKSLAISPHDHPCAIFPPGRSSQRAHGGALSVLSQGKVEQHTNWHSLSFYGDLASLALTFDKGDHLFVEGCMEQRQFTPADGSRRIIWDLIVHACHLISDPRPRTATMLPEKAAASNGPVSDEWPVG